MIFVCVIKETPLNKRALLLVNHLIRLTNRFHELGGSIWIRHIIGYLKTMSRPFLK